jgi:hypothetical protein
MNQLARTARSATSAEPGLDRHDDRVVLLEGRLEADPWSRP